MSERVDVAIIGAGVVGLSTARRLARSGAKVVVLDSAHPGGQGSRAAAGVCVPSVRLLDDSTMLDFAMAARTVVTEEVASLTQNTIRRARGVVRPALDSKARETLELKAARAPGFLGRWIDRDELFALEPALAGGQLIGGFLNDEGFMIDAEAYLSAMLHDASVHGARVLLSTPVLSLEETPEGARVQTSGEMLHADRVVVCAGAWSGNLPGLPALPVRPQRGQLISLFHPTARVERVVSGATYLTPWRAGEILVGATEDDVGFANHTTPAGIAQLVAMIFRIAPLLREARFVSHWSGLRSVVPGGRPLIGAYPGMRRVFLATGHAGQGILTGGATGQAVFELLTLGKSPMAEPFDPTAVLARRHEAPRE